jgi:neutral ceramidase
VGVTLVFADLWSCSLRLWLAALEESGSDPDSLALFGTHTHTGPSRFVGGSFYEVFGAKLQPGKMGYDPAWTRRLAQAIASAVKQARAQASAVGRERMLAVVRKPVWGASRNRSQEAFVETPEYRSGAWWRPGAPGESFPAGLPGGDQARSIDPRLDTLVALETDGRAAAVCGFFGCHATALGPHWTQFDRDWPGVAVDLVERAGLFAALGTSAAGDVTPLRPGEEDGQGQGPALRDEVGGKVGEGLLQAALAAEGVGRQWAKGAPPLPALPLDASAGLWRPALDWEMGLPAMAGSEDGRSGLPWLLAAEGRKHHLLDRSDPQSPKIVILSHLQELVRDLFDLELEAGHPWHRISLGAHLLQTVPGEPTGVAAHRLSQRVRAATGAASCTIAGYSGDYAGYFTTEEEYCSQQYEGGSTLYGRESLEALARHLETWAPRDLAQDLATLAGTLPDYDAALAVEAAHRELLEERLRAELAAHTFTGSPADPSSSG